METEQRLSRLLTLTWVLMGLMFALFVWPTLRFQLGMGNIGQPREVTPRGELADYEKSTIELFQKVSPSVVYINTSSTVRDYRSRQSYEVESGTGSGFVWDEAGHIVTNYHVIEKATSAEVVFADQSIYQASLVGKSESHDLAVLKVEAPATVLQPIQIGSSRDLVVGQTVYAIGNPFGLNQSLSSGLVSALSRSISSRNGTPIDDVIQTDAAINPGNSGGPLLDSAGRLIGVNTAIYSPSGTSAGIGFAIPVDTVNRVVPRIVADGEYRRPVMGITVREDMNQALTRRFGVEGVAIIEVVPDGGAAQAGLTGIEVNGQSMRLGDVIQAIDGKPIKSIHDLYSVLDEHQAGDTIEVTVARDGQQRTVTVALN